MDLMALYLGTLLFAFMFSGLVIIPYIDWLYGRKKSAHTSSDAGGLLVVGVVCLLFALLFPIFRNLGVHMTTVFSVNLEVNIVFLTFLSFAVLGFISDYLGLSQRYMWGMVGGLAMIIATMMTVNFNIRTIYLSGLGSVQLGWWYLPVAAAVILVFTLATWECDQLDGLSGGLLLICLLAFWAVSVTSLDTPLSIFIALWIGSLVTLLYFNVYPARIKLGLSGRLSFGATLAVVGLLLGKTAALMVIGGGLLVFATPVRRWLLRMGWEAPKVVLRAWLLGIILAVFGLWLALL